MAVLSCEMILAAPVLAQHEQTEFYTRFLKPAILPLDIFVDVCIIVCASNKGNNDERRL